MRLISFNIWGGTIYRPLMDYIGKLSADTDIFCFQEVFSALPGAPKESSSARMFLFDELKELLPEFSGFFDAKSTGYDFSNAGGLPVSHGLAIFARRDLSALYYQSEIIEQANSLEHPVEGWVKAQILSVEKDSRKLSVINFHGVGQPGDKTDTPQRINHAKKLGLIWDSLGVGAKILCGDFNMYPDIESIRIIESFGRNLIKDFKIQNTRNELSWKKYPDSHQTFADFTFVSSEVKVKTFEVPYNEVSDHLPMILEFTI
jgi:endonuclease/exonuclease/phosphatase family metal-dependent hydrolase